MRKRYRPYDCDIEMVEDFKNRFPAVSDKKHPIIFLKKKTNSNFQYKVLYMIDDKIVIMIDKKEDRHNCNMHFLNLKELFKKFTYLDGSPLGKIDNYKKYKCIKDIDYFMGNNWTFCKRGDVITAIPLVSEKIKVIKINDKDVGMWHLTEPTEYFEPI